ISGVVYHPVRKREIWAYCSSREEPPQPNGRPRISVVVARWNCDSGKPLDDFKVPTGGVIGHLAFTPDGKSLAIAPAEVGPADRASLRDVEHGTWKPLAPGPGGRITSLAISDDGGTVAAASFGNLLVWDKEGKLLVNPLKPPSATAVCFYPEAKGQATSLASVGVAAVGKAALHFWGQGRGYVTPLKVAGEAYAGPAQIARHEATLAYT